MGRYLGYALDNVQINSGAAAFDSLSVSAPVEAKVKVPVATTNTMTIQTYQATVTVANGATTGKEAGIAMPANFLPFAVSVHVTPAATNSVTLQDIGDDADTDSYLDGATIAVNSTGFKGIFGCNGVRGIAGSVASITGALTTADEVEVVVSGDPGATGVTMRLTFLGILAS
jgi:hypothetical protein